MKPLTYLTLLVLCFSASAHDRSPWTSKVLDLLEQHRPASIDAFLSVLPPELRSKYLLVYGSRSLQSASPEKPRVILLSPEEQFYLSFSDGSGTKPADQSIEIIESYGLDESRFTQITWEGEKAVVERDPSRCIGCHQGAPIFESYPHWGGFFGSSHNGKAYGEKYGAGQIPRQEFEVQALKKFVDSAPALNRYRRLLKLDAATVTSLSELNTAVGAKIIHNLHERQALQVYESARTLEELNTFYTMSFPIESWGDAGPVYFKEVTEDPRYAGYLSYFKETEAAYGAEAGAMARARLSRYKALVAGLGTEWDRTWGSKLELYRAVEGYRTGYEPLPPVEPGLGVRLRNRLNYFDEEDYVRYPGMFYRYWRSLHPEAAALPHSNALDRRQVRQTTALTLSHLLSSDFLGQEHAPAIAAFYLGRNHRDFAELYERVPLPLKQFTWEEFGAYPRLSSAVEKIQKRYLAIIEKSPLRGTHSAAVFRELRSWSPENRAALEKLLGEVR